MKTPANLVVGIGSPHGDDRAGWRVIDLLQASAPEVGRLCRAKVPHELLDLLDGVRLLHVVDACRPVGTDRVLRRFEIGTHNQQGGEISLLTTVDGQPRIPDSQIPDSQNLRSATSHQLGLLSVMQLALALRTLPGRVVLWAISGDQFAATTELDSRCEIQACQCAQRIREELADA